MITTTTGGLTSILVPCCNQVAFTRLCLQALFRHTRPAWELILIDNGSTDATADYLAGIRDAAPVPVTLIRNAANLGFPRAINQGLRAARGENLVLLNNDAVVTDGWLDQLIGLSRAGAAIDGSRDEARNPDVLDGTIPPEGGTPTGPSAVSLLESRPQTVSGDRTIPPEGETTRIPPEGGIPTRTPPRPSLESRLQPASEATKIPPEGGTPTGNSPVPSLESRLQPASDRSKIPPEGGTPTGTRQPAAIGLVGPMSNYAPPPQWVEGVPYRSLDEMHDFARRWRDEHRGRWLTAGKLSGFCLLMTRAVYEAVGGLDERFGLGFFDDDDLAVRARRAGFALAVARDLFVHHFGSRTFAGIGIDAAQLLEENARKFAGVIPKSGDSECTVGYHSERS